MAVLISGTGSNLKVLIDAIGSGELNAELVHVISNRAAAPGLDHARKAGIPYSVINAATAGAADEDEDEAVARCLHQSNPDLVLLSGYMRILGAGLVGQFEGRMINQHPSLLPLYKGLDTYSRVLDAGDREHGASIHFVTAELDDGPIIAQTRIPVESADSADSLAGRLGPEEHRLLLRLMELFARGRVTMEQGQAMLDGRPMDQIIEFPDTP